MTLRDKVANVDMVDLAGRFTVLKKVGREFKGPCPLCGGTDRFWVPIGSSKYGSRCGCKLGKSGDAIDLLQAVLGLTIPEALERIGAADLIEYQKKQPEKKAPSQDEYSWRTPEWQSKVRDHLALGVRSFRGSESERYLRKRGITSETAEAFNVGHTAKFDGALMMPHIGKNGMVSTVKYRLLKADHANRFRQIAGGQQTLFGAHLAKKSAKCILVEGEINAMSIWQAVNKAFTVDVFSFAGMGMHNYAMKAASRYCGGLIWTDEREASRALAAKAGSNFNAWASSEVEGRKGDANDVLVELGDEALLRMVESLMP